MTDDERNDAAEQQPEAPQQAEVTAEEKEQAEAAPRMPGLWLVCVLLGLAGVFSASLAVMGTSTGRIVFGIAAAPNVIVAVGLWRRWSVAWYGALGLVAVKAVCWVVNYGAGLGGAPWAIGAIALNVLIAAYLIVRRSAFLAGVGRRPCLAGGPALCATAVVVVVGAGWWWWAFADAPAQMFGKLMVGFPTGRGDNGFASMERIMKQCRPLEQADAIEALLKDAPAPGSAGAADWTTRAKALVEQNGAWLKLVDALLKAPQFFPPHLPAGARWYARDVSWLKGFTATVRLLVLDSQVKLEEGDAKAAMEVAQKAVKLTTVPLSRADSLLTYRVAKDAAAMALAQVRAVAAATNDPKLVEGATGGLDLDDASKAGAGWALAAEYRNAVAMVEPANNAAASEGAGPFTRMIVKAPCAKPNMTAGMIGMALSDYACEVEGRKPWDDVGEAVRHASSYRDLAGALGWLRAIRNPAGDTAALRRLAGMGDIVELRLAVTADSRLTIIDLALRACRLKEGKLSDSLDALAPQYPEDRPDRPLHRQAVRLRPDRRAAAHLVRRAGQGRGRRRHHCAAFVWQAGGTDGWRRRLT